MHFGDVVVAVHAKRAVRVNAQDVRTLLAEVDILLRDLQ